MPPRTVRAQSMIIRPVKVTISAIMPMVSVYDQRIVSWLTIKNTSAAAISRTRIRHVPACFSTVRLTPKAATIQ
ncbi:MAG: hypothetical protein WCE94_06970 [Candidatus Methanoperedens sp.]